MHNKNKDGGIAGKANAGAAMDTIPRKALTAIPVPGCRKAEILEAETIDQLAAQIPQEFKVDLRKTDGSPSKETIEIKSMEDIELNTIINNSETLKGQFRQQEFLAKFQNEMTYNPAFRKEMEAILKDENRKKQLLKALEDMQSMLKNNKPPVLDFLLNL